MVVVLVLMLVLAGCGDSGATTRNTRSPEQVELYLEADLPTTFSESAPGDTFTDVQCIHRDGNSYDCTGHYRMGLASAKSSMAGIDTSNFAAADWRALQQQGSGQVKL